MNEVACSKLFVKSHPSFQCQWYRERLYVYIFDSTCTSAAQIFAIFEMLTTLGNSRVTFQVHLNEKCVSSCCMNCYKTGVAYAHHTVCTEVDLWMERRSAAEPALCCSAPLATASPTCSFRGRQLSFIGTTVTFAKWKICNLIATEVIPVMVLRNIFFVWWNVCICT